MHEWNKYITENIRHALMFNTYGKHPLRFEHTYKELGLYPYNKFIDVVGRNNPNDSIKESVVVEIKSGWSDFNSGHGLNFFGNWNFLASDTDFSKELLHYMCVNRERWKGIGLLEMLSDGSVITLLPAKSFWKSGISGRNDYLFIENHFDEELFNDCNDDIPEVLFNDRIGLLLNEDDKCKPYPIETLSVSLEENVEHFYNCPAYIRENLLGFDAPKLNRFHSTFRKMYKSA